jgi:outer membrane protein assembly factor BamA
LREAFITDRIGFSVQEEARPWDKYVITFGYRLERTHTYERVPDPIFPFDVTLRVAPLTTSFTRDTRDDIFDAARGSLISHAFEWAPEALGSQLRFVRYFGQYFKYIPLSEPSRIPWSGLRKSRLVFATAARIGLAGGLGGQILVPSERFFAGGGTTIRGFQQDYVGPLDFDGQPNGGDALFILNNEIRFPMVSIFDGVGFLDVGNVYERVRTFDITDLRKTAGMGLRVRTPYFLLRFDYGLKLGRRPGEGYGRFFFSIGQAF